MAPARDAAGNPLPEPRDRTLFDAELTPHRSLSPRGFVILMSAVCAISFAAGLAFYLAGAWPVVGFLGLDVALIYIAFRINYRRASIQESLRLTRARLTVERVNHWGETKTWHFAPAWLQVAVAGPRPGRGLVLRSHGRALEIGRFLTLEERQDLAGALRRALARACASCAPCAPQGS